jgi:hypothetical protein
MLAPLTPIEQCARVNFENKNELENLEPPMVVQVPKGFNGHEL